MFVIDPYVNRKLTAFSKDLLCVLKVSESDIIAQGSVLLCHLPVMK